MIDMMDLDVPKREFFENYMRVGDLLSYSSYFGDILQVRNSLDTLDVQGSIMLGRR